MIRKILIVLSIVLVIGVLLILGLFSDKDTSTNVENALKNGSREVFGRTVQKAERSAKKIGYQIEEGKENTVAALKKGARQADQMALDASISMTVKMKLANDDLVSARRIDVDTTDGVVTLSGVVSSDTEASRAVELAQSAHGVRRVVSRLEQSGKNL